jgi:hypothetical protein
VSYVRDIPTEDLTTTNKLGPVVTNVVLGVPQILSSFLMIIIW